jgi:DNA-binding SARP family transcriptional activator/predicted ATPase
MPSLSLSLLGHLAISWDGRPLTTFRSNRVPALLVYLTVAAKRPHRREALMELLWPGLPAASARQNLRQTLYLLRQEIPELAAKNGQGIVPLLLSDRHTVQLNSDGDFFLDVARLEQLLNGQPTADKLAKAVVLYRGDFLADFYLPDSENFEEWAAARRAVYRRLVLDALTKLTAVYLDQANFAEAEKYARQQLEIDNLYERGHRQLIEVLARNGRRRAALSHYESLSQLLQTELSIEPSLETQALVQAIRAGEFVERRGDREEGEAKGKEHFPLPTPHSPLATSAPPHNLPTQATPFIGREAELAALDAFIADPEVRLVTIVGAGGMGKTRLALACAERHLTAATRFPNGVFFANLAPLNEADQLISALIEAVGFQLQGRQDGRSPQQQLLDYLRQKKLLLLLDNFEHLLSSPPSLEESPASHPMGGIRGGTNLVADILQAAPDVQILVTSRERLYLHSEQLYPIQGLEFPDWETPEDAAKYTAVQLFLQSSRRNQPDFALRDGDDLTYLARICRTVAGMPLALELAASWVDMLPLVEIATELQQGLDFLETEMQDIPERHRSVRTAIDYSWQKLDEKEQDIFAKLSVFRGGFTREAAQAVAGADLRQLSRLVNKSLLQGGWEDGRYQIHELLRQYGAEKLVANPESEKRTRDQHSIYYCARLGQLFSDLRGTRQQVAMAQIEAENDNVRVAWYWAAQQKHWEQLDVAVNGLSWFYILRGRYEEGEAACRQAAARLDVTLSQELALVPPRLLAQIWVWQANFDWILGDKATGTTLLQQSLALLESQPEYDQATQLVKAHALHIRGLFSDYYDDDLEPARQAIERSLAIYQAIGDQWGEAWCLRYLGSILQNLNFKHEARHSLENSLTLFKAIGDKIETAMSLQFLSFVAVAEGQYKKAEQLGQESLLINEEVGIFFGKAQSLIILAWVALSQGQLTQADSYFEKALVIARDMGDIFNSYPAIIGQSCIQLHKGEYEQARTLAQQGFSLKRSQYKYNRYFLSALGDAALALGEYEVARHYLQENVDVLTTGGEQHILIEARGVLGVALLKLGYLEQARQQFYEALQLALQTRSHSLQFLLAGIAVFLSERGDWEQAIALYTLAKSHPLVAISRWFADVYGRSLETATAALPQNIAKQAKANGQALDLWETAESLLSELTELGWGAHTN